VLGVEVEDPLPLLGLDPEVSRHARVVLVRLAVALLPVEVFPARQPEPADKPRGGDLGLVGPGADEVDQLVARVVGNPAAAQGSPSSFFSATYSSEISAITASFLASFCSSWAMRASSSCSRLDAPAFAPSKIVAAFSKSWRCH